MRPIAGLLIIVAVTASLNVVAGAQTVPSTQPVPFHAWWQDQFPGGRGGRGNQALLKKMPKIKAEGNHFVDADGKTILFRGVATSDPDKLDHQGHWSKDYLQHVKDLGCNIVRIPVHPVAWRERTPVEYLKLLDQAIAWSTELDMYVMIDWHTIGNLETEMFQDPMYNTTKKETFDFWRTISRKYNGNNTVAFYELFNEPTTYRGQLGKVSWHDWKNTIEDEIHIIRAFDKDTVIICSGFDWSYDLTPLREEPINASNIGYAVHPYSNKRPRPWEPKWEEDFGFAADTYPMIATEFGFGGGGGRRGGTTEVIDDDHYANRITRYLEGKGISWIAWCYDPQWGPSLLRDWDYNLTPAGEFFKMAMNREPTTKPSAPPQR